MIIYTLLLAILAGAFVTSLAVKKPLLLDVMRDRNALYRDVGTRGIENTYVLHALNKDDVDHSYELSVSGIDGIEIATETRFEIPAETLEQIPVAVTVPHEAAAGGQTIEFTLTAVDGSGLAVTEESRFRGPLERN